MKLVAEMGYLRGFAAFRAVRRALAGAQRTACRIVHFSLQSNHLHLLIEAADREALWRGLRSFQVSAARRLNKARRRRGRVFIDRYHQQLIRTPAQMRASLAYVLNNGRRHGVHEGRDPTWLDPYSSSACFDGWATRRRATAARAAPLDDPAARRRWQRAVELVALPACVAMARTWLATTGWRIVGLIDVAAVPGPRPRPRRSPHAVR